MQFSKTPNKMKIKTKALVPVYSKPNGTLFLGVKVRLDGRDKIQIATKCQTALVLTKTNDFQSFTRQANYQRRTV